MCQVDHVLCIRWTMCYVSGGPCVMYQVDHVLCVRWTMCYVSGGPCVMCQVDHVLCVRWTMCYVSGGPCVRWTMCYVSGGPCVMCQVDHVSGGPCVMCQVDHVGVMKELRVIRAERRAFTVSETGYPDNQWHFVCDTQAFYGHKTVTLRSILQVGHSQVNPVERSFAGQFYMWVILRSILQMGHFYLCYFTVVTLCPCTTYGCCEVFLCLAVTCYK